MVCSSVTTDGTIVASSQDEQGLCIVMFQGLLFLDPGMILSGLPTRQHSRIGPDAELQVAMTTRSHPPCYNKDAHPLYPILRPNMC